VVVRPGFVMAHVKACVVSLVIAAGVALPLLGSPGNDDFPLSTYPMFSGRKTAEADIAHAVAVSSDGQRRVLPPDAILNDEVIQAFETLRRTIARGPADTRELCEAIAERVRHSGDVAVEIVTDRYDAVRYFEGEREPLATTVHVRCEVPRS
jgi:hypothetical protein